MPSCKLPVQPNWPPSGAFTQGNSWCRYLGADRTFLDHEFMKHGSCIGGYLTRNKTAFFERAGKETFLTQSNIFQPESVRLRWLDNMLAVHACQTLLHTLLYLHSAYKVAAWEHKLLWRLSWPLPCSELGCKSDSHRLARSWSRPE